MVGVLEPYVEVCRRLSDLYPGTGSDYKSVLVNSGAEAVENAVKIARAATGRPAVIAFDRSFHGRTLLTMSLTSKVTPYKRGFGPFAPEVCRAPGILYVDDEVQAGVGRTGPLWAIEHYGVEPDLLVSGKSLGGGLPLAAVTGRAELMDAVGVGGLGGTFGGNPVACAAACAVLDEIAAPAFRARAEALGERIRGRLEEISARTPQIGEVRGLG